MEVVIAGMPDAEDDWKKYNYDGVLGSWVSWYLTAAALHESADVVFASLPPDALAPVPPIEDEFLRASADTGPRNVYVLLAALALENLLRGEMVRRDPQLVRDGRLGRALHTKTPHDLPRLAQSARFTLVSHEEEQALRDAFEARRSWGAYPAGHTHDDGALGPRSSFDVVAFKQVFDELFRRLEASLTQDVGPHG